MGVVFDGPDDTIGDVRMIPIEESEGPMKVGRKIGRRWRTWAAHLAIAAALVQLFQIGQLFHLEIITDPESFRLAGSFYTLREVEQHISKWRTNPRRDWLLAAGDVASAWAGAGLSWWLLP